MSTPKPFTIADLSVAVKTAAAIRLRRRLQPAGGPGDKIFPPTYEGGTYALETRVIDGQRVPCVLLDSAQSQANRMELALLSAQREKRIGIPVIGVDFAGQGLSEVGVITSLEAPHRIADAILRDSFDGATKFRDSPNGKLLNTASTADATGLFGICPTALVFGLWDSTGPRGGLGTKFQRSFVGELVAIDIETGAKPSSRIDPLGIQLNAGPLFAAKDGGWTLVESEALQDSKGKAVKLGKEGKPSEANHGNVTPSLKDDKTKIPHHGGVTCSYALHTAVLSLPALRRLHFPVAGKSGTDAVAQTVLAALALCGAVLAVEQGCDLRSRCLLVPEQPAAWEIIAADGTVTVVALTGDEACALLTAAVAVAKTAGLPWQDAGLTLTPSPGLVTLVKKSRELAMSSTEGE